jgi:hypothetical protein
LLQVISRTPISGAARNSFDCAGRHVVLLDPGRLRTTAMIDTVTMVLALMSAGIFLAHAFDGFLSRA